MSEPDSKFADKKREYADLPERQRAEITGGDPISSIELDNPGTVPLTPGQRRFFEQEIEDVHHWNQAVLLETREPLSFVVLEAAVRGLVASHDAFRLRFCRTAGGWQQRLTRAEGIAPCAWVDLAGVPREEQRYRLEKHAADVQKSLHLENGPVMRVAYFDLGGDGRLLFAAHHLVVDAVSWRIIIEDFYTACRQLEAGQSVNRSRTASFPKWAERLSTLPSFAGELAYWKAQTASPLPQDHARGENDEGSAREVEVSLGENDTDALLRPVHEADPRIDDMLLAALARSICAWTGARECAIDIENHGRGPGFEDFDLSRTVGRFTAIYPVVFSPGNQDEGETLEAVREALRRVPSGGLGYGILRYLSGAEIAAQLRQLCEVSFNYLGQMDKARPRRVPFAPAKESPGPLVNPASKRPHLIAVSGYVSGGRLSVSFRYSENRHRRETAVALAQGFLSSLSRMIRANPNNS